MDASGVENETFPRLLVTPPASEFLKRSSLDAIAEQNNSPAAPSPKQEITKTGALKFVNLLPCVDSRAHELFVRFLEADAKGSQAREIVVELQASVDEMRSVRPPSRIPWAEKKKRAYSTPVVTLL